jgi:hypothetical protein
MLLGNGNMDLFHTLRCLNPTPVIAILITIETKQQNMNSAFPPLINPNLGAYTI